MKCILEYRVHASPYVDLTYALGCVSANEWFTIKPDAIDITNEADESDINKKVKPEPKTETTTAAKVPIMIDLCDD